ncbi:hypothetical protein [Reyranella sp.]|uniref:hypothetical protein n=1 Tax=Reyranella sp. TaxID=1929291 RepID=UPI003D0BE612
MSKPDTDAAPLSGWMAGLAYSELQEVTYLRRALEIAERDGLGVSRAEVQRIESTWSIAHGDWSALGFVLLLHDGSRVYLDYDFDFADDQEEVELQVMTDERYPVIKAAGIEWTDNVAELNRLLLS